MPSNTERQARPLSRKVKENLRQEEGTDLPSASTERAWREKPKTEGERQGKRRREALRQLRRKGSQGKGTRAKAKGERSRQSQKGKARNPKRREQTSQRNRKGCHRPGRGNGTLRRFGCHGGFPEGGEGHPRGSLEEEEERGEGAGEDPSRDPPGARPKMGKSKILGAALAGALQAQAKRMPKDKILKKNRVGSLVAAHQAADRFAQRQRLRRQLRQELPRGSVGAKRVLEGGARRTPQQPSGLQTT